MQKEACCHVRIDRAIGYRYYRRTSKTRYHQDDPVKSFPHSHRLQLHGWRKSLAVPFGSLRAALKHPDRVRGITSSKGQVPASINSSRPLIAPFPVFEGLVLRFGFGYEPKLPDTFLKGPDVLDLHHLRRLKLYRISLPSISVFLASATALTDLCLLIDTVSCPSPETSVLACLQGMLPCAVSIYPYHSVFPTRRHNPQHAKTLSLKINTFPLLWLWRIPEHSRVRVVSPVSPRRCRTR